MKQSKRILLCSFFILLASVSSASTTVTAIRDGDWSDPVVWSAGRVPGDNDIINIPVGYKITVDINSPTYVNMVINLSGTLKFEDGKKLNLDIDGHVNGSSSAELKGGNPGSKIRINGITFWTGGSGTTFGPFTYEISTLPIELVDFSAEIKNGTVELKWTTATETNNDFFTIEKTENGVTFDFVAKVNGAGNSTSNLNYSAMDNKAIEGVTCYYRLKQTDFDGNFEYSPLLAFNYEVKKGNGCVLKVHPNPCTEECVVDLVECDGEEKPEINVELVDAGGNKVFSKVPLRDAAGSFSFTVDTKNNLKPGIYIIRGVSRKENYSKKVIVK